MTRRLLLALCLTLVVAGCSRPWQADTVIGQPDFVSGAVNAGRNPGPDTLRQNAQVLVVQGRLLVADSQNNRVLIFNQVPTGVGAKADLVLGQPDFQSVTENQGAPGTVGPPNARTLDRPAGLASDGTRLFVLDRDNHRVLIYRRVPTESHAAADVVIGHDTMEDNSQCGESALGQHEGVTARCLSSGPTGLAYDETTGALIVADTDNDRVLIYRRVPEVNGVAADVVIGQSDFTRNYTNQGRTVGADTLDLGTGSVVGIWQGRLFIADRNNHRVLIYNRLPDRNGASADIVIGQPDFESREPDAGGAVSSRGLRGPRGVFVDDRGWLFIPEAENARVLVYRSIPTRNGQPADFVIGQRTLDRVLPGVDARTFQTFPYHLTLWQDRLIVSDSGNHRVLIGPRPR